MMTVGCGAGSVILESADPLLIQVDVQVPLLPVPVRVKVVFGTAPENGGNMLVITVGRGAGSTVTSEGAEPLLVHVDVHTPPVPVPVNITELF